MRRGSPALFALIAASLLAATLAASPLFFEDFAGESWRKSFIKSTVEKYSGELIAEVPEGLEDAALKVTEKARHYGYAAKLGKDVDPSEGLVLQYELKLADGLTCGGAYLKFLNSTDEFDAAGLVEDTPYVVMFGPDKCGATNKVHLIIRHKAPNGEIEEKHLKSPPLVALDSDTHVYTAILKPSDNTYEVLVDGEVKKSGSLFEDFEPPFNPPEEIDDPEDKKPEDWVDEARIADPDATKPDDWDEDAPPQIEDPEAEKPEGWLDDEPQEIDDPEAEKPEDWDDEEDGEWEPPKVPNPKCTEGPGCGVWKRPNIPNPAYKGKWNAPLIDNPAYKGPWAPRKIPNPDYFLDEEPLKHVGKVGGIALEIWTMDNNYYFDNILLASTPDVAESARATYWQPKKGLETAAKEKAAEEEAKKAEAGATLGERISALFDLPGLSALRGPLDPALELIEDNEYAAYGVIAFFVATPILFYLVSPKSKAKKVAKKVETTVKQAKKEDKATPDDKPTAGSSEIIEDEDEDEKKGVRRRARRD